MNGAWRLVPIPETEVDVATALTEHFAAAYRAAGCPEDAEVFHEKMHGYHIYYFSPLAFKISREQIQQFSPSTCDGPSPAALRIKF
jgi:hypothetical protein